MVNVAVLTVFAFTVLKCSLAAEFEVKISEETYYVEPGEEVYLECECFDCPKIKIAWFWTPCKVESSGPSCSGTIALQNDRFYWIDTLTLHENSGLLIQSQISFTPSRSGIIGCTGTNNDGNSTDQVLIIFTDLGPSKALTIKEFNYYEVPASDDDRVILSCGGVNYFFSDVSWYQNGQIIETGTKWVVNYTKSDYSHTKSLIVNNFTTYKSGEYECRATFYNHTVMKLTTKLYFRDSPYVRIDYPDYVTEPGREVTIESSSYGYQKYEAEWFWTPCHTKPYWPSCSKTIDLKNDADLTTNITTWQMTPTEERSVLKFVPKRPGIVKFTATSSAATDTDEANVLFSDLGTSDFYVFHGIQDNEITATGETVKLTCGALIYVFSNISWYRNGTLLETGSGWEISLTESEYSFKEDLIMHNVTCDKSGEYECRATYRNDSDTFINFKTELVIQDRISPNITYSNMNGEKVFKTLGENFTLECRFDGLPKPAVSWYKDAMPLEGEDSAELFIDYIKPNDGGDYMCNVSNRIGFKVRRATLVITDIPELGVGAILGSIIAFVLFIFIIVFFGVCFFREKKLQKELDEIKADELANFDEGAIECINPALPLDEQAILLPYNPRFEFPREKLKLGEQIGAGAFGVVLRGVAEGILNSEKKTTVAVKMVSKLDDNLTIKSLVSELKIMVHLGQHLNLVNLLGAVTKSIAKRELMIIVEYCQFGNTQNFLQKHRTDFVNEINWETDQIDCYVGTFDTESSERCDINSQGLKYSKMSNNRQDDVANSQQLVSSDYITEDTVKYLPDNNIAYVPESKTTHNDRESNASYINVNVNIPAVDKPKIEVTTTNLVSWGFQVARGMDYLATRKVLHGDLAARNILLCHDNVVKICDFGLARSMYKTYIYKKEGDALLPFKWLALESMSDLVFSTKSDVWSFGITLWELFSLARTPYPGMNADQDLFFKLRDGYRLEKPEYANQAIYDIMLECWKENPEERPTFKDLENKFSRILGEEITNHYLDLNQPYMMSNSKYIQSGELDFVALMRTAEDATPENPLNIIFKPTNIKPSGFSVSDSPNAEQNRDNQSPIHNQKLNNLGDIDMLQGKVNLDLTDDCLDSSSRPPFGVLNGFDNHAFACSRESIVNQ